MSIAYIHDPQLLRKTPTSSGHLSPPASTNGGDKSDAVKTLRTRLHRLGYLLTVISDEYADDTERAIKDFQYLNGIEVTNIANPDMITKLDFADAKKRGNRFRVDSLLSLFPNKTIRRASTL